MLVQFNDLIFKVVRFNDGSIHALCGNSRMPYFDIERMCVVQCVSYTTINGNYCERREFAKIRDIDGGITQECEPVVLNVNGKLCPILGVNWKETILPCVAVDSEDITKCSIQDIKDNIYFDDFSHEMNDKDEVNVIEDDKESTPNLDGSTPDIEEQTPIIDEPAPATIDEPSAPVVSAQAPTEAERQARRAQRASRTIERLSAAYTRQQNSETTGSSTFNAMDYARTSSAVHDIVGRGKHPENEETMLTKSQKSLTETVNVNNDNPASKQKQTAKQLTLWTAGILMIIGCIILGGVASEPFSRVGIVASFVHTGVTAVSSGVCFGILRWMA